MKQLFIDIETTCEKLGIDLSPEGVRLVGFCPYHTETRGSFNVYRDTNSWYCYSCNTGGDPLKLVSSLIDDVRTWSELIKWFHDEGTKGRRVAIRVSPPIGALMAMFTEDEVIEIPASNESQDEFLISLGITYASEGFYGGRHIIPVHINGRLMTFEARDFTSQAIPKTLYPRHRPIHSYLWNIDNVIPGQPIIVVEGIKGAIAVLKFGYFNVVSSFGARLTPDQVVLLMTKQPPEITIAYDADTAGEKGSQDALVNVLAWSSVYTVKLPDGTDPWDVSLQVWEECLDNRTKVEIAEKNQSVIRGLSEELFV